MGSRSRTRKVGLEGTPGSRRLCEAVRAETGGCCLLGFSRGKDSLATWLWLRQFFERVIPFHVASVPHLLFVDESLAYYERWFGTKIERCLSGTCTNALADGLFQPWEDHERVLRSGLWSYDNNEIAQLVREKHGVPDAWTAYGITRFDSIFRRQRISEDGLTGTRFYGVKSFYPIYDWNRDRILDAVVKAGLMLPDDYLLANRTLAGIPDTRELDRMRVQMPEDYARIEMMFPFIGACVARNEFRRMKLASAGIRSRGTRVN